MANWCNNTVVFEGNPEAIEQIKWLFQAMAEKQEKEGCGQLPDFVNQNNGGYFFYIHLNDENTDTFEYQTKWSPNIEIVQEIAEHFKQDDSLRISGLSSIEKTIKSLKKQNNVKTLFQLGMLVEKLKI